MVNEGGGGVLGEVSDVPNDVVEEGEAGVAIVKDDDGGDGGDEVGDGREVRGEVDPNRQGYEEGPAEEEHLVTAKVPTGHSHGNQNNHERRHNPQLHCSQHFLSFFFFLVLFWGKD